MTLFNSTLRKRAIAYYRHSAEDKQENSVAIQRDHAIRFAKQHNIEIIHEEADEGKSGLSADRRGFQNILTRWVFNDKAPPFEYILVYDVSRWGRFQNPDEAATYQYQCTTRGKKIVFIDRGMPRDDQLFATHLQTHIERLMAAEYSRQLSGKVFYGSVKVSEQGYSAGGTACYGMARLLLDVNKQPIRILKLGEHKQISNERVTFVPANDETTEMVKEVFCLCVEQAYEPSEIAEILNEKRISAPKGGMWNKEKIAKILQNETYTGTRIYNKTWGRLKQKSKRNPRSEWVIRPGAFPAVVTREVFEKAQKHLEQITPSRPRKGVSAMRKLRYSVYEDLKNVLRGKGLHEDDINRAVHNFPLIFSNAFIKHDTPHWCFVIGERMRNFDFVIAIGINLSGEEQVSEIFSIPTQTFTRNNFAILSKNQKTYSDFLTQGEQLDEKVHVTVDRLKKVLRISDLYPQATSIIDAEV